MNGLGASKLEAHELEMDGGTQTERGQERMKAVGMTGKIWEANSPQNKPLQANTAGGPSARHRPHNKRPQMTGLAANNSCRRRRPLAVQVSGGSAVVLAAMKAGSDLPTVPTPPIAFACHCPYPLP